MPFGVRLDLDLPACLERSDALEIVKYAEDNDGDSATAFAHKALKHACGFVHSKEFGPGAAIIDRHLTSYMDKRTGIKLVIEFRIFLPSGHTRTYTGFLSPDQIPGTEI